MEEQVAIKSGYYFEIFRKSEIPEGVVNSGRKVRLNNVTYDLYKGTSLEAERSIDNIFGDRMGYDIDSHEIKED